MMGSSGVGVVLFATLVLTVPSGTFSQSNAGDWRKDLKVRLEEKYPKAKLSFDGKNLKAPGTPLLLMQPNVLAERKPFWNYIKNGALQAPGKTGFASDLLRQSQNDEATRDRVSLALYQPVYLTNVTIDSDKLVLFVATSAQFIYESVDRAAILRFVEGTSRMGDTLTKADASVRQAGLVLEFAKGGLEQLPVTDVIAAINRIVLRTDDPSAPQFGNVALGMTREQVIVNLGKPKNTVNLGTKEILVYPILKVTLVDGKVTDVQ